MTKPDRILFPSFCVALVGALLLVACDADMDGVQAIRATATAVAAVRSGQPVPTETPAATRTPEPTATPAPAVVATSPQVVDAWIFVAGVGFAFFLLFAVWLGHAAGRIIWPSDE